MYRTRCRSMPSSATPNAFPTPRGATGRCLSWVIRDWSETTADQAIFGIPQLLPVLAMQPKNVMCHEQTLTHSSGKRETTRLPHVDPA